MTDQLKITTKVYTKKTVVITLTEEQAAKIICERLGVPTTSTVKFDCGYEFLKNVQVFPPDEVQEIESSL